MDKIGLMNAGLISKTLTSSPSFITTVPAFATTANTMTAHRARRTDMVMLAKAGRFRIKSRRISAKNKVEKQNKHTF